MRWQPIETCDRLTTPGSERVRVLVYGEMGIQPGYVVGYPDGDRKAIAEGFHGDWAITHWMPLPEPPQADPAIGKSSDERQAIGSADQSSSSFSSPKGAP